MDVFELSRLRRKLVQLIGCFRILEEYCSFYQKRLVEEIVSLIRFVKASVPGGLFGIF